MTDTPSENAEALPDLPDGPYTVRTFRDLGNVLSALSPSALARVLDLSNVSHVLRPKLADCEAALSTARAEVERLKSDLADMTMQRDVMTEKLNEYIDKTKEAERALREERDAREAAELNASRLQLVVDAVIARERHLSACPLGCPWDEYPLRHGPECALVLAGFATTTTRAERKQANPVESGELADSPGCIGSNDGNPGAWDMAGCRPPEPPDVDDDKKPREPGCLCHWEEGDSPCPVHGEEEPTPAHDAKADETREAMSAGSPGSVDPATREDAAETPSGGLAASSTQRGESGGRPTPTEAELTRAWNITGYLKWMPIARFVAAVADELARSREAGREESQSTARALQEKARKLQKLAGWGTETLLVELESELSKLAGGSK